MQHELPPRTRTPPYPEQQSSLMHNMLPSSSLNYATVCSSNINRSVSGAIQISNLKLPCKSFGIGTAVKLPGKTVMEPKVYKFMDSYQDMYLDLSSDDAGFFQAKNILYLCKRAAAAKVRPNNWQSQSVSEVKSHDVVICFEHRIYDVVVEDMLSRDLDQGEEDFKTIMVICLDTKDNPKTADIMARIAAEMCWELEKFNRASDDGGGVESLGVVLEDFGTKFKSRFPDSQIVYQLVYL